MFEITTPVRDPMLDLLYRLERRMGRVFNEPFRAFDWKDGEPTVALLPLVDIVEDEETLRLFVELPGVKPEEAKIFVEGNLLTIKGTKEQVVEEKGEKLHRYERAYGAFERSFTLPTTVQPEKIKAAYENGVLTITLPKMEAAKPHQIKVDITVPKALK